MDFVKVTANRGKEYVITVIGGEAVKVSNVIHAPSSIGHTTYSRKLWEKGDARLSLTAHCALNAWRRLAEPQSLRCRNGHSFKCVVIGSVRCPMCGSRNTDTANSPR